MENVESQVGVRERTFTEKGLQFQQDIIMNNLRLCISKWRRRSTRLETAISDSDDIDSLRKERDALDMDMKNMAEAFNELQILCTSYGRVNDYINTFEEVEREHHELHKRISVCICDLRSETGSHKSKMSHRSQMSHKSKISNKSHQSRSSALSLKLETVAEAAGLQALRVIADARLKVIGKGETREVDFDVGDNEKGPVLPSTGDRNYTADYVNSLQPVTPAAPSIVAADNLQNRSEPTLGPESVHVTMPTVDVKPPVNQKRICQPLNTHTYNVGNPQPTFGNAELAALINLGRMPPPEPGTFSGDPLMFPQWRAAFNTLVVQRGIPPSERIYYLKKYLSGTAREAVEGYFLLMSDQAYEDAMTVLESRFGNAFIVANAFRSKLDSWPRLGARDSNALLKLADFLRQCDAAMLSLPSLSILNDDQENRKLLHKLPDWLVSRWARVVVSWREDHNVFPPFKVFKDFIVKEATIASDPVTNLQGLRIGDVDKMTKASYRGNPKRASAKTLAAGAQEVPARGNVQQRTSCPLCESSHNLNECESFLKKTLDERKDFAKETRLCFGCLNLGHISRYCKERKICDTCNKRHPTSLHGDSNSKAMTDGRRQSKQPEVEDDHLSPKAAVSHFSDLSGSSGSTMIVPVWLSHRDQPDVKTQVYAMLDTQSDTTFILDSTCKALGITGTNVTLSLSTMYAEKKMVDSRRIVGLEVSGLNCQDTISLPVVYTREIMPANREHIPTPETAETWPHLERIKNELVPLMDCEVGLLIGYNCPRALAPRDVIPPVDKGPYGLKTDLGWSIVGTVSQDDSDTYLDPIGFAHKVLTCHVPPVLSIDKGRDQEEKSGVDQIMVSMNSSIKEVICPADINTMMELDFVEHSSGEALSVEDRKFISILEEGICLKENHYEMPLPFRDGAPYLSNNRVMALNRLKRLKYAKDYADFMEDIISNGFAERVPEDQLTGEEGHVWYVPHHGVRHPKKPNSIRVVFDCSAVFRGESLNQHLLQGPDQINALVGVLCRFRQEAIAFTCDIQKMFHQFKVRPAHRDYLRFLWWSGSDIVEYRMTVHLFGAVSSPGCANFALKRTANDNEAEFGAATATFVRRNFYVDDGVRSVATEEEAIELIDKAQQLCAKGGLRLHKIISNSKQVLNAVKPEDRANELKDLNLLSKDPMPIERALGIQWCIEQDTLSFRIVLKDQPLTRRGVLSTVSSVYDPLGFIAPVILVGRMILQAMCMEKADWDDPVSQDLRPKWDQWRNSLLLLESLQVPRCYKPVDFGTVELSELHHFSDASQQGYGQCTYLRQVNDRNEVTCSLVMGKSRVAPLKHVTIPRLELTAATVSVKISSFLRRELDFVKIKETFWTDSQVVLGYINNSARRFHVFVANRVQQIQDATSPSQWHHVRSEENPADDASRGISVDELLGTSKWLSGPDFLWKPELPSGDDNLHDNLLSSDDPEVKGVHVHAVNANVVPTFDLSYFSDWTRAKRAVAACINFINKLKDSCGKDLPERSAPKIRGYVPVTVDDLCQAEYKIIKMTQIEVFREEIESLQASTGSSREPPRNTLLKGSKLYKLDPFLDDNGILRVGGRLKLADMPFELRHPIILPRKHHVSDLIMRHFHERTEHSGRGMTINEIRSNGYWIIGCSSAVSWLIAKCVTCRKLRGNLQEQKMANLPVDRISPAPPFSYCGVDFFGPWIVKEGRREVKRYGSLFTCMASRAVHVETANSLTTDSFINALRRFVAIRGPLRLLRSDQGTNFVGAERELREALLEMDQNKVRQFLTKEGCDYVIEVKMNVPSASHRGGVWERQIKSVRGILASLLLQAGSQLNDESLRTLLCECMAIINSRPLTVDNLNDPMSLTPLTPNHLLTAKSKLILPPPGEFQRCDLYSQKHWRRVQYLANLFWSRWRKNYLQILQLRHKWVHPRRNLREGDLVIVKDVNLPRCQWQIARVCTAYMDGDNQVRKVRLEVANANSVNAQGQRVQPATYLERPIQKLVLLLEVEDNRSSV